MEILLFAPQALCFRFAFFAREFPFRGWGTPSELGDLLKTIFFWASNVLSVLLYYALLLLPYLVVIFAVVWIFRLIRGFLVRWFGL